MTQITIEGDLADKLTLIAEARNQSVTELLQALLQGFETIEWTEEEQRQKDEELDRFVGMLDDDITDLSMTVRETLKRYYAKKSGNTD